MLSNMVIQEVKMPEQRRERFTTEAQREERESQKAGRPEDEKVGK